MTERKSHMHRADCADGKRSKDTLGNRPKIRQTLNWEKRETRSLKSQVMVGLQHHLPQQMLTERKEGVVLSDNHLGHAGFQPQRQPSILRFSE